MQVVDEKGNVVEPRLLTRLIREYLLILLAKRQGVDTSRPPVARPASVPA